MVSVTQRSDLAKNILVIGDYGKGSESPQGHNDLAFFEVVQQFKALYRDAKIQFVSVPPFDSARTAALAHEAANSGEYDLVFHNTAPRKDAKEVRVENAGEDLAYTQKEVNGKNVTIVGVASGNEKLNTFSYFRGEGCNIYSIDVDEAAGKVNTQFRSRDSFPIATKRVTDALQAGGEMPAFCKDVTAKIPALSGAHDEVKGTLFHKNGYGKRFSERRGYITVIAPEENARSSLNEVAKRNPKAEVDVLAVHSGEEAWLESGFALQQLALSEAVKDIPDRSFQVFLNAHPAQVYEVVLDNGVHIRTDNEQSLYLLAPRVQAVTHCVRREDDKPWTQEALDAFRTRAADTLAEKRLSVAYADGYGNLKLVATHEQLLEQLNTALKENGELKDGEEISRSKGIVANISFRGQTLQAKVTGESFGVADGETALSQGSSGHGASRHVEVFLRGGNAQKALGNIKPGERVEISNVRLVDKSQEQKPANTVLPAGAPKQLGQAAGRVIGQ